jgi:hypothetical protein
MPLQCFQDFVWENPLNCTNLRFDLEIANQKGEMKAFKQRLAREKGQGQGNKAAKIMWTATAFLKCRLRIVQIQGLESLLAKATLAETLLAFKNRQRDKRKDFSKRFISRRRSDACE